MSLQLTTMWQLVAKVSQACAVKPDNYHGNTEPRGWPWSTVALEYHVFGIFMVSHAFCHNHKSRAAWEVTMNYFVARCSDSFRQVRIEGRDFENFIATRVETLGRYSNEAVEKGRDHEIKGWVHELKNNIANCTRRGKLELRPPLMISDFFHSLRLETHVMLCMQHFYFPLLYKPLAAVFERCDDVLAIDSRVFDDMLSQAMSESKQELK